MPADFWLEDEDADQARNKAYKANSAGTLVLMTANSQGSNALLTSKELVVSNK